MSTRGERPEGPSGAVTPSGLLRPEEGAGPAGVVARAPDFAALEPRGGEGAPATLDRVLDVTVTVAAELGRVTVPISAVLGLGVGSVLELGRSVSEPVDLLVQGARLARGEVVVVGDCFAVRIKEICEPKKR